MKRTDPGRLDPDRFPVDEWCLCEHEFRTDDIGLTETLFSVGNGYLGMRGNLEEGREAHAHGTFVNGFHETWPIHHAEEAYGFAQVGQTIINVPDTKLIKLYVNDEPLLLPDADIEEFERHLDFRSGVLRRSLIWRTPSGKRVRVTSTRMVSFEQRHLAVMTFDVELLDHPAPVTISSQLLNRQDGEDEYHVPDAALGEGFDDPRQAKAFTHRVLQPQEWRVDGDRVILGYRATNSGMTLAAAMHHEVDTACQFTCDTQATDDVGQTVITVDAQPGSPIRLTKYASYHTSKGVPARELADRVGRTLDRALVMGVDRLHAEQRLWLDAFWSRADVRVGGAPDVQQAVRWNLFQLAQASARVDGVGIPAKGLTGQGYEGHYFWDSEVYVLPFLAYTLPHVARNLLRFRHKMLPKARQRAAEMSQRGALYPWRTINGDEASAYYAAGTAQYHINADVIYALRRYLTSSGDEEFLRVEGAEMLVETARLWVDLGFHRNGQDNRFHIHGVTGPDEYTTVVNDNLFTNVMARANLAWAADVVEWLGAEHPADLRRLESLIGLDATTEPAAWRAAADCMELGWNDELGIHAQDDSFLRKEPWDFDAVPPHKYPLLLHFHPLVIYRFQVLKQADVVLAMFLQGDQFTATEKRANFDYYDPITTGDSSLSACVQSIVAAEVGEGELALRYFHQALFMDLVDLHGNSADGVHVASMGGVWAALVHGFGGFRDHGGRISFDPRLPDGWTSLRFPLAWRDGIVDVTVDADTLTVSAREGCEPIDITIAGEQYTARPGAPVAVPIRV